MMIKLLGRLFIILFISTLHGACEKLGNRNSFAAKSLYDFGLGKRAYAYVSQYKRLPVYNFGLGKRSTSSGFSSNSEDMEPPENIVEETYNNYLEKRGKQYDFGLGKRLASPLQHQYSFGLGKRFNNGYNFGLGKRGGKVYGFGLGKKDKMYSFGLGKRTGKQYDEDYDYNYDEDYPELANVPINKRLRSSSSASAQKFNFGLGKRSNNNSIKDDFNDFEIDSKKIDN